MAAYREADLYAACNVFSNFKFGGRLFSRKFVFQARRESCKKSEQLRPPSRNTQTGGILMMGNSVARFNLRSFVFSLSNYTPLQIASTKAAKVFRVSEDLYFLSLERALGSGGGAAKSPGHWCQSEGMVRRLRCFISEQWENWIVWASIWRHWISPVRDADWQREIVLFALRCQRQGTRGDAAPAARGRRRQHPEQVPIPENSLRFASLCVHWLRFCEDLICSQNLRSAARIKFSRSVCKATNNFWNKTFTKLELSERIQCQMCEFLTKT